MSAQIQEVHGESFRLFSHRMLEISGIALFAALSITLGWYLVGSFAQLGLTGLGLATVALVVGWMAADFASGFVHWLGDTFGTEDMPVLGAAFITPFRQHHVDPKDITRHDFVETNGNNCITVILLLGLPILGTFYFAPAPPALWMLAFLWMVGFATFMTNQVHRWAHMESPPTWVFWMQRAGLFMSAEHHNIHHRAPYDTYFCITCGWCNPILDRIDFFVHAERFIRFFVGPRRSE